MNPLLPFMVCRFLIILLSNVMTFKKYVSSVHRRYINISIYCICRKWVPNVSKFSSNLRIKFKFERRHLISVHCIVLLERLPVTRQQQPGGAGWQQWWLLTPYGQTQVTCMVRHYTGRHSDIVHIVISD